VERSKTAAWCLAALIAIATCGGCTLVPFTDVVERDPDAPLTRAAEKAWSDCIVSNVDTQARDPRRLRASDLASGIISACRDEKSKVVELADVEHFKSLANGLDRMYSPAAVAVMLELARAKREGIGAINTPGWDGLMNGITQAELDSRLLQWDECSEAAVPFLAKGNPQDNPMELAQRAAWDYCGMYGQNIMHKFLGPPAAHDPNAMGKLVPEHERTRRSELARLVVTSQAQWRE